MHSVSVRLLPYSVAFHAIVAAFFVVSMDAVSAFDAPLSVSGIVPSNLIFRLSDRLNMEGVNAAAHAASVVTLQARRDRANDRRICESVCEDGCSLDSKHSISVPVSGAVPYPTAEHRLWANKAHEALKTCKMGFSHSDSSLNRMVRPADASNVPRAFFIVANTTANRRNET
jgi:hypothetical protein